MIHHLRFTRPHWCDEETRYSKAEDRKQPLSKAERLERACLAEFQAEAEFLAEKFSEEGFKGLNDFADILRRKRKEV